MTLEQAQKMIEERFIQYPTLGAVGRSLSLEPTIAQILDHEEVDHQMAPLIAHEVRVVLALYAPLSELGQNIAETTGLEQGRASSIATLIRALILDPVTEELEAYEYFWKSEEEKAGFSNIQAPVAQETRPLTRDELMKKLELRRSSEDNLEVMKQKLEQAAQQKVVGYDAANDKGGA